MVNSKEFNIIKRLQAPYRFSSLGQVLKKLKLTLLRPQPVEHCNAG
jgi:hypothetical protein